MVGELQTVEFLPNCLTTIAISERTRLKKRLVLEIKVIIEYGYT
jgi:hypothetical protein